MSQHDSIQQLTRRLDALTCVAIPTRRWVLAQAQGEMTEAELVGALADDGPLALIERAIQPVANPHFVELCRHLTAIEEPDELLPELPMSQCASWDDWQALAFSHCMSPMHCLFCLANLYAKQIVLAKPNDDDAAQARWLLGQSIGFLGRPDIAIRELEAFLALDDETIYRDRERLTRHLYQQLAQQRKLTDDNAANFVRTLADTLVEVNRSDDAAVVLDAFTAGFEWLDQTDVGMTPGHTASLLERWLRFFGDERETAEDVCTRFVSYVRECFQRVDVSFDDRQRFVHELGPLRQRIVELAEDWGRQSDSETEQARLQTVAVLWDAELGQRLLLERFVMGKIWRVGTDGAALMPSGHWPFQVSRERLQRPSDEGRRFAVSSFAAFDVVQPLDLGTEAEAEAAPYITEWNLPGEYADVRHQAWFQVARRELTEPMTEGRLAQILGANSLLLRATFSTSGVLLWTALLSDGETLRVIGQDSGTGQATDRLHIAWAIARHDLRIALSYQPQPVASLILEELQSKSLVASPSEFIEEISTLLNQLEEELTTATHSGVATKFIGPLVSALRISVAGSLDHDRVSTIQAEWKRTLTALQATVSAMTDPHQHDAPASGDVLGEVDHSLARRAGLPTAINEAGLRLVSVATRDLLADVQAVWSLEPLAKHLSPNLDVVLHVDDELRSLPIAMLRVGEAADSPRSRTRESSDEWRATQSLASDHRSLTTSATNATSATDASGLPMFQQVRSVRSSLSLLLDVAQRATESEMADVATTDLLTISSFLSTDPALAGAIDLHEGQCDLAKEHGLNWRSAAHDPTATLPTFFHALHDTGYRVVTTCGHGDAKQFGMSFPTHGERVFWTGQGADLARAELLMLVSCSLGSIAGTGSRDVEGFCVQLALARVRSVVAARWPVECHSAADFANLITKHYLQLTDEAGQPRGETLSRARLRAFAFNEARREMLSRANGEQFLNTIAAFDLWGLA